MTSNEYNKVHLKYPDRIPIIVRYNNIQTKIPSKYLVQNDFTLGNFLFVLRKKLTLLEQQSLFVFVNKFIPSHSERIDNIYREHKNKDGFLYFDVCLENTYG